MTGMVLDLGHALNQQRHPRQGPEIRVETVGPRTLPQCPFHPPELLRLELWLSARPSGAVQGADAAALPLRVPSAHALTADLQLTGNRGQDHLAAGKQAARLFAPVIELLKIAAGWKTYRHAFSIDDPATIVTILCETQ
jgi:hypothetical protein